MDIEFKRFRLLFAGAIGIVSVVLTLLLTAFLMDTVFNTIVLIWGYLNIIPGLISVVAAVTATGNPHHPDEAIGRVVLYPFVFLQWTAIGYLASKPIYKRVTKGTPHDRVP